MSRILNLQWPRGKTRQGGGGDDLDAGSVSDERVYFNYTFQCTSGPFFGDRVSKDSLLEREVTVNANIDNVGEKVADAGGIQRRSKCF